MIHGAFCGAWAFDEFRKPFEAQATRCTRRRCAITTRAASRRRALGKVSLLDYASDLENFIAGA